MRLIYALIMIAGFAFLLWSIDKSMPVYADNVTATHPIYTFKTPHENYSPICKGQTRLWGDESYLRWDDDKGCFMLIEHKSGGACQDTLKEAEEALASCQAYVDSLNWVTIPEGWKVESVEGEWSEEEK